MLQHKTRQFSKVLLSNCKASVDWRTQVQENQLVTEVSSILLQRLEWVPLLQNLNLSSKLTSSLFLKILRRTQNNPQISLNFFNWAKTNLGFEPDLKSHCHIIQTSVTSGLSRSVKPLLDYLVQTHPPLVLVESITQECEGNDSKFSTLGFILETYSRKCLCTQGLEVYGRMRGLGYIPSIHICNGLLDALQRENKIRLALCFYCAVVRSGLLPNRFTWALVAQIFARSGKFERICRILELGIYSPAIYSLIIDGYSEVGKFDAAFNCLNEMDSKNFHPGFAAHSSILDGACKYENSEALARIASTMTQKKLVTLSTSDYDSFIQKLCDLGKTYAAEMYLNKACDEKIKLKDATYGLVLRTMSAEGRIDKAMWIYHLICKKGMKLVASSFNAFANVLFKQEQSEEVFDLLVDIIRNGYNPCPSELSGFISALCRKRRWREAEDMLNMVLEKGITPDSFCCCSLVEHYCSRKHTDLAIGLHDKMENLNVSLDTSTYNVLLKGLFAARRMEEAGRVFDNMRKHEKLDSASFVIMIRGLCSNNELRAAMKIHDEMLKLSLKPDQATYKRLITAFK